MQGQLATGTGEEHADPDHRLGGSLWMLVLRLFEGLATGQCIVHQDVHHTPPLPRGGHSGPLEWRSQVCQI